MNTFKTMIFVFFLSLLMLACSDNSDKKDNDKNKTDHVWKQQTDALKSAKEVAGKLEESLKQHKQKIDGSN